MCGLGVIHPTLALAERASVRDAKDSQAIAAAEGPSYGGDFRRWLASPYREGGAPFSKEERADAVDSAIPIAVEHHIAHH